MSDIEILSVTNFKDFNFKEFKGIQSDVSSITFMLIWG